MKRLGSILLCLSCLVLLSACRVRTGGVGSLPETGNETLSGTSVTEDGQEALSQDTGLAETADQGTNVEDREAERRIYDEDATADIREQAERAIVSSGEGEGESESGEEGRADQVRDQGGIRALRLVTVPEAERKGTADNADAAQSALEYYTVLLQEKAEALFECKRVNVYWETREDLVTVHKTSTEHSLILLAGAYDVSARLLPENLHVDDGWVVRKSPDVIVKVVPKGQEVPLGQLQAREGWDGIPAIREEKIVFVSEEFLGNRHLEMAATLMLAALSYPEVYADVDVDMAVRQLADEAGYAAQTAAWDAP